MGLLYLLVLLWLLGGSDGCKRVSKLETPGRQEAVMAVALQGMGYV